MATATRSKQMLETHLWPGDVDLDVLASCIDQCFACSQACSACSDACLSEDAVAELRKSIRLDLDCAQICEVTGRVLTRQTGYDAPTSAAQVRACIEICNTCAEECERHAEQHEHCRICAEACRACAQACDEVLAAFK